MTIDDKILKSAKLPALSSGKIDKYSEEILPLGQSRTTEQAKFTYSPSGKALEKQAEQKQLKIKVKNK